MKNYKTFLYLILFGFAIPACSPIYYIPDTHNIPLISEKGENNISLAGNLNQVEFQVSRGITNSIALKANGGLFKGQNQGNFDISNRNGEGSGKFIEIGAGYFNPFKENWIFEAYGLFGMGSVENSFERLENSGISTTENISANIRRFGIQPNIGFKNEDFLVAFSTRFINLSYRDIEGDLIFEQVDQQDYLRTNDNLFLIEPALSIGILFNKFDVQLQLGTSFNITNTEFRQDVSSTTLIVNYSF